MEASDIQQLLDQRDTRIRELEAQLAQSLARKQNDVALRGM
jgi:hypothetical protein